MLATLIDQGQAPTRSALEDRALALFRCHGLPRPRTNHLIEGTEVDFFFPEARLIVEVDGARYHDTAFARRNDAGPGSRPRASGSCA